MSKYRTQEEAFDDFEKQWDYVRHLEDLWAAMTDGAAREEVWEDMAEASERLDDITQAITRIRKQEAS